MGWSMEQILEFIEALEDEEPIWNHKHKQHKDRDSVYGSWIRLQKRFNIPIKEMKKKKDTLFATYRKLSRKVTDSKRLGRNVYTPIWSPYKPLDRFLRGVYVPVYKTHSMRSGRSARIEDEPKTEEDQMLEAIEMELNDKASLENEISMEAGLASMSNMCQRNNNNTPSAKQNKMGQAVDMETIQSHLIESNNIMKTLAKNSERDICFAYAELLAIKLREFDEFRRAKIMNDIDNLIFQAKVQESS
ncbi:uncharacterized protein [Prorops nasuta]|uniref:uncharacterized protein isoform X2 n=1 Tax=Prorops nasuta TaxID=863751 RepID=UPI0034CEDEFA